MSPFAAPAGEGEELDRKRDVFAFRLLLRLIPLVLPDVSPKRPSFAFESLALCAVAFLALNMTAEKRADARENAKQASNAVVLDGIQLGCSILAEEEEASTAVSAAKWRESGVFRESR